MTATLHKSFSSNVSPAQVEHSKESRKLFSENSAAHHSESDVLSELVIKALWASFPEEHSEEGVAIEASPYFRNKQGEAINPRTIKYWLRGETLPSALHLSALIMMQPKLFLAHWVGGSQ